MRVSIIPVDETIIIDGKSIKFDYSISDDIHAIQWKETEGEIEYKDINKPNEKITDFSDYQYLVGLYNLEAQKIKDEETDTLAIWESSWERIHIKRNGLLSKCDWTQLPDVRLTIDEVNLWRVYRDALRDITINFVSPAKVIWPKPPVTERVLRSVE